MFENIRNHRAAHWNGIHVCTSLCRYIELKSPMKLTLLFYESGPSSTISFMFPRHYVKPLARP